MRKRFLLYIFIILLFFAFFSTKCFAYTYETFENYQLGDIGGQGLWYQMPNASQFQVTDEKGFNSEKSLKVPPYAGSYTNGRYFDNEEVFEEGKVTFYYHQNTNHTHFIFTILNTTGSYSIARFYSTYDNEENDLNVYYFQNNQWHQIQGSVSPSLWNKVEITFRKNPDDNNITYVNYVVNNAMSSGWVKNSSNYDGTLIANQIIVENTSAYSYRTLYVDEITIEPLYNPIPYGYYGYFTLTNLNCGYNQVSTSTTVQIEGELEIPSDGSFIRHLALDFENLAKGTYYRCMKYSVNAQKGQKTSFSTSCILSDILRDNSDLLLLKGVGINQYLGEDDKFHYTEYDFIQCSYYLGIASSMPDIYLATSTPTLNIPSKEEMLEDCNQYEGITDKLLCKIKNIFIEIFYPSRSKIEQLLSNKNALLTKFPMNYFAALVSFFKSINLSNSEITLGFLGQTITFNPQSYFNMPFIYSIYKYLRFALNFLFLLLFIKVLKKEFDFLIKSMS